MSAVASPPDPERRTLHHACGHRCYWEAPPKVLGRATVLQLAAARCPWCSSNDRIGGRRATSHIDVIDFRMPSGHSVYVFRTRTAQLGANR